MSLRLTIRLSARLAPLALVLLLACGGSPSTAPSTASGPAVDTSGPSTAAQPSAEQVIEAYIEATGGRTAREAKQNYRARGRIELPQIGVNGKLEVLVARPDKMLTSMELGGMGSQKQGTIGELVWETSSTTGARIVKGNEAAALRRASMFNAVLKWKELFEKAELIGESEFGERPAWEVAFHTPEGTVETSWYDKETRLLLGTEATLESQMGSIKVKSRMSDWREVDGIKMAFVTEQDMVSTTLVLRLDEISYDIELPEETFTPPAEVEALRGSESSTTD